MRRTDIEALRVLTCALVILLHALLIFSPEPLYHLKSADISPAAGIAAEFLRVCTMPLFFVLAGQSAVGSLSRRTAAAYLRDRVDRLLVPLLTGIVLLCPFIKYIELRNGRDLRPAGFRLVAPIQNSLLEFVPRFFTRMSSATWSHLWFLAYLLVISIALLPVLMLLSRRIPEQRVPGLAVVCLPGLGLAALVASVGGYWPYYPNLYQDWGNVAYYGLCVLLGACLAAWPGFETRLRREFPWLLVLMAASFTGVATCGETTLGRVFVGLTAWFCAGGLIGLAGRYQPRHSALLTMLGRFTLPVYVLHHLPLLLVALVVMRSEWPWAAQVPLIWVLSIAIPLALTTWVVAPWRLTRRLFGIGHPT